MRYFKEDIKARFHVIRKTGLYILESRLLSHLMEEFGRSRSLENLHASLLQRFNVYIK